MAQYGNAIYGLSTYGSTPASTLSVSPMTTLVVNYTQCYVYWNVPGGEYSQARLVRNQNAFSENQEDGVTVWSQVTSSVTKTAFNDGGGIEDTSGVAIVPGKPIYYTMFLLDSDNEWVNAGSVQDIIPSDHGMQDAIINYLPRVFTSAEQSPLAEVDKTSDLYQFLSSAGFIIDELLTSVDLLQPNATLTNTPVSLLPIESSNYGQTPEVSLPYKNQKKLVRDAIYTYTVKGTSNGLQTYVQDLTGYPATITPSLNAMLSVQDNTFYKGTGNWVATGGTITSSTDITPPVVSNAVDTTYTCKIVASGAGHMSLGNDFPITRGISIDNYVGSPDVTMSVQIYSASSAGTITPSITTYDGYGNLIGTTTGTAHNATSTWSNVSLTATPSSYATSAVLSATGAGGYVTYTTPSAHGIFAGNTVTITGLDITAFNGTDLTVTSVPTPTTFVIANSTTGTTSTPGYVTNNSDDADYVGITLAWSAAGTYYVDMVCLEQGDSITYDDAVTTEVFLYPNKTNYIHNPSFEVNVTDSWTLNGSATASQATSVPDTILAGTHSAKIIGTGSWTYKPNSVTLTSGQYGQYFNASLYLENTAPVTLTLETLNGSTVVDTNSVTIPISSSFERSNVYLLVPPNSTGTTLQMKISGSTGTFYIDGVQLEQTYSPTDYFDGSLPESFGAVWGGTVNNSPSYVYYSKALKMTRLANTLNNWVPMNSFWRIRSYEGVGYTSLTV
jgi:hypothetical protein